MHASGVRLLIKKVYENDFTWKDLEAYFCMSTTSLKKALYSYFDRNGVSKVINRITINVNNTSLCK